MAPAIAGAVLLVVLVRHAKVLTPFSLRQRANWLEHWVQRTIGRNAVDDDRRVPENAEEKLIVLGVEAVDVGVD